MLEIPRWGPSYMVSFSIVIKEIPRPWPQNKFASVLHFTTGENVQHYGNRIPMVWVENFHNQAYIRVNADCIYGEINFVRRFKVELGKRYDITIKQWKKNDKYWNQIIAPGVPTEKFPVYREWLWPFHNVKLFTSDEWYDAFTSDLGELSNLKIENNDGDLVSLDKTAPL